MIDFWTLILLVKKLQWTSFKEGKPRLKLFMRNFRDLKTEEDGASKLVSNCAELSVFIAFLRNSFALIPSNSKLLKHRKMG